MLYSFRGYLVCDGCGRVERGAITLERRRDGWVDANDNRVVFQEAEDLPDERWLVEPQGPLDRGRRLTIRGVAVVRSDDSRSFVLDVEAVEQLQQLDQAAIEWLPVTGAEVVTVW